MSLLLPLAPSRSRLSYPYLEVAGRAWLASAPSEAASTLAASTVTSSTVTSSSMASLLFRIAKAAPGDKVRRQCYMR